MRSEDALEVAQATVATNLLGADSFDGGVAARVAVAAQGDHYDRLVEAGVRTALADPYLLRDEGGDPFVYAVPALSA